MPSKVPFWKWLAFRLRAWQLRDHARDLRRLMKEAESAGNRCALEADMFRRDMERHRDQLRRIEAKLIALNYEMGER